MAITQTIPLYSGTVPNRNQAATEFRNNADNWLAYQAPLAASYNGLAVQFNAESQYIASVAENTANRLAAATAASNFKGLWSSLSGAGAPPYTVLHNNEYWVLTSATNNVSLYEPGLSVKWAPAPKVNPATPTIEQFFYDGTGRTMSASINAAAALAVSLNKTAIYTNIADVTLTAAIDMQGCALIGNNTVLTPNGNDIKNLAYTQGVKQFDGSTNRDLSQPMLPAAAAIVSGGAKVVYENGGDVWVATKGGATPGGILTRMLTGNVNAPSLPSDSLNTAWEAWRVAEVLSLVDCIVCKSADSETGSWVDFTAVTSGLQLGAGAALHALTGRRSTTPGNTITFTANAGIDGVLYIGFQTTTTSDTACQIRVDGVLVDTVNLAAAASTYRHRVQTRPGTHTVELTHGNSVNLYVYGVNFYRLADITAGQRFTADKVASYVISPAYITNNNAHDYAFRDKIDDLWGGSYHGGETAIVPAEWRLDSVAIDPTVSGYVGIGQAFNIFQRTSVDWSTQSLEINNSIRFGDSQFQQAITCVGEVQALTFLPGMSGTSDEFKTLMSTHYIDDVTLSGSTQRAGNSLRIEQINRSSGQRVISEFTGLGIMNSPDYGGATVNYVSGLYNKLYLSPVRNSDQAVVNPSWVFTRTFA